MTPFIGRTMSRNLAADLSLLPDEYSARVARLAAGDHPFWRATSSPYTPSRLGKVRLPAERPGEVIPRLVALAMEICDRASAGGENGLCPDQER
jgi:hypothetical protein